MFSKYFASSFRSPLRHLEAAAPATLFPRIILLKPSLLSTSTIGDERPTRYPEAENTSPISKFLLNECELCQSEVSKIFKKKPSLVGTISTNTSQQAVQFMRDLGFTVHQVRNIITINPSILTVNADRQMKPKIEFLKTLDLTAQDLLNITYNGPRFLFCSLEKTIRPNIQYLQNLLGSEVNFSKVLKSAPQVLVYRNGPECFENKIKHLATFGLLEDEIKELVKKSARILNMSMEKMQKNMDFFIHTAGLPAKFILAHPTLLTRSLETRIKPRYNVLKSVSAMQPSRPLPSLTSALYLSEGKFLENYVNCSPHATKLLEIYSGKPVDLDVVQ